MQQYKYIKGSAEDFVGAPSWAAFRARNKFGDAFVSAGDDRYGYVTGPYERDSKLSFINYDWYGGVEVIAQREPIPEWSGEGLPPVGTECEYTLGGSMWSKCNIDMHVGTQGVVMSCDVFEGMQYVHFINYPNTKFRPIRTEAERKRESVVDDLVETIIHFYDNPKGAESYKLLAERIFDAVDIGKIPGIKLD